MTKEELEERIDELDLKIFQLGRLLVKKFIGGLVVGFLTGTIITVAVYGAFIIHLLERPNTYQSVLPFDYPYEGSVIRLDENGVPYWSHE